MPVAGNLKLLVITAEFPAIENHLDDYAQGVTDDLLFLGAKSVRVMYDGEMLTSADKEGNTHD